MPIRTPASASPGLRWDIFCRVVDNLGDAAICWRLARQLANEYSLAVRLWIDQPQALSRLVPGARPGQIQDRVSIECWRDDDPRLSLTRSEQVADVVKAGGFGSREVWKSNQVSMSLRIIASGPGCCCARKNQCQ